MKKSMIILVTSATLFTACKKEMSNYQNEKSPVPGVLNLSQLNKPAGTGSGGVSISSPDSLAKRPTHYTGNSTLGDSTARK